MAESLPRPVARAALDLARGVARAALDLACRVARTVRDLAHGVAGTHAYDQYVAHCRAHHPERALPSREEFFRREFTAKWDGVRRCC